MCTYLDAYAKKFDVFSRIKFESKVVKVIKNQEGWQIISQTSQGQSTELFDFVIVATGIFSKAYTPEIPGLDQFKGALEHTKDYKSPEKYKDKRVVMVGGAYSGAEVAAEIASHAKSITNVISQPFWVLPRYIPKDFNNPESRFPLDLIFYKRSSRPKPSEAPLSDEEAIKTVKAGNKRKNGYFSLIQKGNQSEISQDLQMDPASEDPTRVIISDSYLEKVSQKEIVVKKGQITQITETEVIFDDQTTLQADVIIFATGYQLDLPFFDQSIKQSLSFEQKDQLQPVLLHKCTFHPELHNMAFVGMYRGPYFAIMELQARWATMVFSGKALLPTTDEMLNGVEEERKIREQNPRPQFPHGDYIAFADSLAQEIGMPKDLETLKNSEESVHKVLWDGPVVPAHFRFFGHAPNKKLALELSEIAVSKVVSLVPPNNTPSLIK